MTAPRPVFDSLPDWPRLLDAEQAAAYLGMSRNTFKELVRAGTFHEGMAMFSGTKKVRRRWDRTRLDREVDVLMGIGRKVPTAEDAMDALREAQLHEGQGRALRHRPA